jgi:outer membrane lipoprotein-sorting protein
MTCLLSEQLVSLALGEWLTERPGEGAAVRQHLRHCPACAAALRRVQEDLDRVAAAQAWFERGHDEARERLLAALPTAAVGCTGARGHGFPGMREVLMRRRKWVGVAAVLAIVGLFLGWQATGAPEALAQTARALGKVKSYQCRVWGVEAGADREKKEVGRLYWAAPGSYRLDVYEGGKLVNVRIVIRGKPGLEIDHKHETYQRLEPLHQPDSPLELLHELSRFAGKADRELPERKIAGKTARGFAIAFARIDPDRDAGTLRVWPDPKTKLPLRVEIDVPAAGKMIMDHFAWNVGTDRWFKTEPPTGYQDETPAPASAEEQTAQIVKALKVYARYCGGKYPQAKIVYGDVTSRRLFQAAGLSNPHQVAPRAEQLTAAYAECSPAKLGFAHLYTIQLHNPDAAYHGKAVGPADKAKVLFRWKRPDGRYQVIFGDLHTAVLTAEKLKEYEKR